jgi:Uma2 family endonuclease
MNTIQLAQKQQHYTYTDYLEWDEDVRAEIIDGAVYAMSPPATYHQMISMSLATKIANFLEGKSCKVFAAPFGVRLSPKEDRSDDIVVEPDIAVICDVSKLDERGCNGAPDLIIEILSPATAQKDRFFKFNKYLEAEVREYWIVDPETKMIQIHLLDHGRYITSVYGICDPDDENQKYVSDLAPVSILPGLIIDLKQIFGE